MNSRIKNLINVIATGIVVTVMFSLVLFWGRFGCRSALYDLMPSECKTVTISPSGLIPGEPAPQRVLSSQVQTEQPGPNEPNFLYSRMFATFSFDRVFNFYYPYGTIGILQDLITDARLYRDVNERIYYWYHGKNQYICHDRRNGLINRRYMSGRGEPNDLDISMQVELFAGPNGISRNEESSLGQFYDPIVTQAWDPNRIGLYDKKTRRFYVIDFVEGSVDKGLQLAEGDRREPIAIGWLGKGFYDSAIGWVAPQIWNVTEGRWNQQKMFLPGDTQLKEGYIYRSWWDYWTCAYIPVLDKTGRIYIYSTKEKSLTECGYLPLPQSLFALKRGNEVASTRDVLNYQVCPVYAVLRSPSELNKPRGVIDVKYLGMSVACISREGTSMAAAVFDPNGRLIYQGNNKMNKGESTADTVYAESPGASFWTAVEFLLENLQPPVFEVASYLSGDYFEASAGHRALFILPNSFVGMLGRGTDVKLATRPFVALLLMGPSLILSVWLAFRVRKDAALVGLSGTAKKWWTIGTIAFGLPAYITYRLTRTKEPLVTCQNCGKMRRPDMERCHRCGSKWEIPELTPPNWRICN